VSCQNCDHEYVDFHMPGSVVADVHVKHCELVAFVVPGEPQLQNKTVLIFRNNTKIIVEENHEQVRRILHGGPTPSALAR
jgi:hypothetical protein